jgi:hypothetical protein
MKQSPDPSDGVGRTDSADLGDICFSLDAVTCQLPSAESAICVPCLAGDIAEHHSLRQWWGGAAIMPTPTRPLSLSRFDGQGVHASVRRTRCPDDGANSRRAARVVMRGEQHVIVLIE